MSKRTHLAVSVFDAALIRALVNCAAGLNYEAALDDARELAGVLEGEPRMRYVNGVLTQYTVATEQDAYVTLAFPPNPKKESHVASVAI